MGMLPETDSTRTCMKCRRIKSVGEGFTRGSDGDRVLAHQRSQLNAWKDNLKKQTIDLATADEQESKSILFSDPQEGS